MKHILFPTDLSDFNQQIFPFAVILAKKLKAKLHVVHFFETAVPYYQAPYYEELKKAHEGRADRLLAKLKEQAGEEGLSEKNVEVQRSEGHITDDLNAYIKQKDIDLVFLPTHGFGGVKRLFMGNTTQKLLQTLTVPAFTVSPKTLEANPELNLKSAALASDLSGLSKSALPTLLNWSKTFGLPIKIVHVVPQLSALALAAPEDLTMVHPAGVVEDFNKTAKEELSRFVDGLSQTYPDTSFESEMLSGTPELELTELSEQNHEQLLVLTTHGYGGLKKWLLGSVTARVVQTAQSPVLVVPAKEDG